MSNSTNQYKHQDGIDIRLALNILNERSQENRNHHHHHQHQHQHQDDDDNNNNNHHHQNIPIAPCCHAATDESKAMGQTIDLTKPKNDDKDPKVQQEMLKQQQEQMEQERAKRKVLIQERLNSLSVVELLQAVMKAQQERVVTYQEYDRGLKTVLDTGNMSLYPTICTKVTASFSVLSDTIIMIQSILVEKYQRKDYKTMIGQLQKLEQEKLNLTAAYHLEQLRVQQQESADERIVNLLRQGVQTLESKLQSCKENINEALDEIKCSILEEQE